MSGLPEKIEGKLVSGFSGSLDYDVATLTMDFRATGGDHREIATAIVARYHAHAALAAALDALLDTADEPNEDIRAHAREVLSAARQP